MQQKKNINSISLKNYTTPMTVVITNTHTSHLSHPFLPKTFYELIKFGLLLTMPELDCCSSSVVPWACDLKVLMILLCLRAHPIFPICVISSFGITLRWMTKGENPCTLEDLKVAVRYRTFLINEPFLAVWKNIFEGLEGKCVFKITAVI